MKKITYIDLGLPSGTLWASSNSEIRGKRHFTYNYAMKHFGDHMPTEGQFLELMHNCRWKWTELFGGRARGYRIVGPNGKSIFLPACGFCQDNALHPYYGGKGFFGYYWSTRHSGSSGAYYLHFHSDSIYVTSCFKFYGHSIRTVKIKCS